MAPAPFVITAQALTAASFAPFGDVIEAASAASPIDANNGTAQRYAEVASLDLARDGGRPGMSIFRARHPTILPFRLKQVERHPKGSQSFIPIGGATYFVVVAPPGNPPAAGDLRAFLASGTQGINLRPGVWHHPLLALRAGDDFVVIERVGPGDNLDFAEIPGDVVLMA
jgi:ureidoglycolate lyase